MFALLRLPQSAEVRFDGEFHLLGAARVSEACLSASLGQRAGPLSRGRPCLRAGPGTSTARGLPAVWLQAPAGPQFR